MPTKIKDHSSQVFKYEAIGPKLRSLGETLQACHGHPQLQDMEVETRVQINELLEARKIMTMRRDLQIVEQCYDEALRDVMICEDDQIEVIKGTLNELRYRMSALNQILNGKGL